VKIYDEHNVLIREAQFDDIKGLAQNMRKAEVDEVWSESHLGPEKALRLSFHRSSLKYSLFFKDRIVAMFGVVPESLLSDHAQVWMLTSNEIDRMKIRFLKLSRKFIEFLRERYPVLQNFVDCRHERSIAWLEWLGAEVSPPESYGPDNMPFRFFTFGGR
jgi:hypothetical protein